MSDKHLARVIPTFSVAFVLAYVLATEFLLAWRAALDTMSDGASMVGNNIGKAAIDLQAVDAQYSSAVTL